MATIVLYGVDSPAPPHQFACDPNAMSEGALRRNIYSAVLSMCRPHLCDGRPAITWQVEVAHQRREVRGTDLSIVADMLAFGALELLTAP